jgi:2-succinyl-5-enolpyruvyl-6-hydroxy-3-cyclohexene-1-carboxylate synthase
VLHDANSLVVGPAEPRPDLRVVVVNDDGGSIFATLEQGGPAYADAFERVFGTPHGLRVEALAAAAGLAYGRAATLPELRAALARPPRGIEVLEVPIDRTSRRSLDEAVRALA